jgi:LuxR family transcriptional activator of bioluminescence operon
MDLIELKNALSNSLTMKKALGAFSEYLNSFGCRDFAFTYYSGHIKTGRKVIFDYATPKLLAWHNYYLGQDYADIDRTLEESSNIVLPLYWDVKEQFRNTKSRREKRMRKESIEFGIDVGLSVPIHGPNYDFATLTLHQFKGKHCLEDYEYKQHEWQIATLLFYSQAKKLLTSKNEIQPLSYPLTKREQQILVLTAKGWRVEQIAKELGITVRTINFHIQNANKKMGTNSKYLAINKYLQFID